MPRGSSAKGAARVKGDILFRKREYPLWNPKRTRGEGPSTPNIAGLGLEELHLLCSVGAVVHGFAMNLLRVVTDYNRALLS